MGMKSASRTRTVVAGTIGLLALAASAKPAEAQQKTFKLDRLEMAGAPEDGLGLFRPVTNQRTIFFGQLGVGYQLNPLRTKTITTDETVRRRSDHAVIQNQLAIYGNAGFEFFDRLTVALAFPWYPYESGQLPVYSSAAIPGAATTRTTFASTDGPGAGDIRLDLRGVLLRSDDRKSALGAMVNVFFPTGTTGNFGGDAKASVMAMITAETQVKFLILAANTGIAFRPSHAINDPIADSGLGVGNEWRWNVGAFIPLKDGKYRIGGSIFGQTGIQDEKIVTGNTIFRSRNTPIEFNIEGRMRFGPADHWYIGAGAGSSILRGYGAPDLRVLGVFGLYIPILDTDPKSPDKKADMKKWRQEHVGDRDHDGIPDDVDACPDDPEDHLGNDPNDGCPLPKDRDGDGIPDQFDKCPDVPEDKDGIDDGDGCPEDDVDNDGVPDAVDACPRVPGKPNKDPKRNGCPTTIDVDESGNIKVLQRVNFQVGTATLLPDSFPILQEVADYLKATPGIKKMSVEGHTDNTGSADLNKRLSQQRAEACMKWLVAHGVAADRLEAHGFGPDKPLVDNDTVENRAKNRRTEFNIVQQDGK